MEENLDTDGRRDGLVAEYSTRARALKAQGRLDEAAACYRKVLELQPDHVPALGNLGNILKLQANLDGAEDCYRRILQFIESPQALADLGGIAFAKGRYQEAETCYRRAIELAPEFAEAHVGLSSVEAQLGKLDEAVAYCRRGLALQPEHAAAHLQLASILREQGRTDEAVACCRRAVELQPENALASYSLGEALADSNEPAEATRYYRQALVHDPGFAQAHNALGVALRKQGLNEEAAVSYRRALALDPDLSAAHFNLGFLLAAQRRFDEAIDSYERCIAIQPDNAEARNQLGALLVNLGKSEQAETSLRRAVTLNPALVAAHINLGVALFDQSRHEEAIACYRRAVELDPQSRDAHINLALASLSLGRFEEGWLEYEWRLRDRTPFQRQPRATAAQLAGRTILLRCELGMGDSIQFIRYAEVLKDYEVTVVVESPPQLVRLLRTCPGVDTVVARGEQLPPFDVQVPLLSLPGMVGTNAQNIPAKIPYLGPADELVQQWRSALGSRSVLKVGIAWQGRTQRPTLELRAIPLMQFVPLTRVQNVRLYSLQMGEGSEQLARLGGGVGIVDLGDRLGDFYNTAAIVRNMDLVITCDSAPAHLAGALGVPVWVALRFAADWRWLLKRDDSPWYPAMRLFRQSRPGDWQGVFERIQAALRRFAQGEWRTQS